MSDETPINRSPRALPLPPVEWLPEVPRKDQQPFPKPKPKVITSQSRRH